MTTSVSFPLDPPASPASAASSRARDVSANGVRVSLAGVGVGVPAVVVALDLDDDLRAWLTAVGIAEGERITVLRRAIFGGPIHVRTGNGGEFALNRGLARAITLQIDTAARGPST